MSQIVDALLAFVDFVTGIFHLIGNLISTIVSASSFLTRLTAELPVYLTGAYLPVAFSTLALTFLAWSIISRLVLRS